MTPHLREHFDQAVSDDPGVALDAMAHVAIAEGGRMRRRRNRLTGAGVAAGLVAVIGAVAGLNVLPGHHEPPVTVAAALMPVSAPSCLGQPVEVGATDVAVFLSGHLTDRQRTSLETALRADPRVAVLAFESREQAFQKFRARWREEPDLLAAVTAEQLPESFRLRLVSGAQYTAVRATYATMDGVHSVVGRRCSADAPVGGVL